MRDRRLIQVLGIACLPLVGYWMYGLFDLDEGFYAAVIREMITRNEWITPTFNGQPWFEKPILLYWLGKLSVMALGDWFGPRLPSVLASLVGVFGVYRFAYRQLGAGSAQFGALALASMPLWVFLSRQCMTDMLLACCVGMGLLSSYEALDKPKDSWKAGIWIGLGLLAKGPVALLLFLSIWFFALFVPGIRSRLRPVHFLSIPIALLVAAVWYWPAYQANGQLFIDKFFIEQNFGRFSGGDQAHNITGWKGLIYYIPVLLLGFVPWTWQPRVLWRRQEADPLGWFLLIAFLVPLVFFTATAAKLPHYIIPCAIPLALLVARRKKGEAEQSWSNHQMGIIAVFSIASLVNLLMPMYYHLGGQAELHRVASVARTIDLPLVVDLKPGGPDPRLGFMGVKETSHPSIEFVAAKPYIAPEFTAEADGIVGQSGQKAKYPLLIYTRSETSIEAIQGFTQRKATEVYRSELYALFRLE